MRLIAMPAVLILAAAAPGGLRDEPGDPPRKAYVICFDLHSKDPKDGAAMADTIRLKLRRHKEFFVLDRITSQETGGTMPADGDRKRIVTVMNGLGLNVALYGTVTRRGRTVTVNLACLDRTDPGKPAEWTLRLSDNTQRWRAVIARTVVEKITGTPEWGPPQYGDEQEPKKLTRPVNRNGDFEDGHTGWDPPDNVSTFLEAGPDGRGTILRVKTNLKRAPWLAYTRKLRFGRADPKNPPKIPEDSSYGSVAGLEGVHYRSEWLPPATGQRYWVTADAAKPGGTPKVFIKGFLDRAKLIGADGLPETSLYERGLNARSFAALPEKKRRRIIDDDVRKHPDRYRQECYRWYLNLRGGAKGRWRHYAAPFPPRGGLPANVEWFRIDVYSYWPPGEYRWDNVWLYKDPRQKAPLPAEKARTPDIHKKQRLHDDERKAPDEKDKGKAEKKRDRNAGK